MAHYPPRLRLLSLCECVDRRCSERVLPLSCPGTEQEAVLMLLLSWNAHHKLANRNRNRGQVKYKFV